MKKLLILSTFIAIFAFTCCWNAAQPSELAEEAAEYMQQKDFKKLVDMMYLGEKNNVEGKTQLVAFFNEKLGKSYDEMGGISSYEIIEENVNETKGTACVKVKFHYGNGEEDTNDMIFAKKNEKWKLLFK